MAESSPTCAHANELFLKIGAVIAETPSPGLASAFFGLDAESKAPLMLKICQVLREFVCTHGVLKRNPQTNFCEFMDELSTASTQSYNRRVCDSCAQCKRGISRSSSSNEVHRGIGAPRGRGNGGHRQRHSGPNVEIPNFSASSASEQQAVSVSGNSQVADSVATQQKKEKKKGKRRRNYRTTEGQKSGSSSEPKGCSTMPGVSVNATSKSIGISVSFPTASPSPPASSLPASSSPPSRPASSSSSSSLSTSSSPPASSLPASSPRSTSSSSSSSSPATGAQVAPASGSRQATNSGLPLNQQQQNGTSLQFKLGNSSMGRGQNSNANGNGSEGRRFSRMSVAKWIPTTTRPSGSMQPSTSSSPVLLQSVASQ